MRTLAVAALAVLALPVACADRAAPRAASSASPIVAELDLASSVPSMVREVDAAPNAAPAPPELASSSSDAGAATPAASVALASPVPPVNLLTPAAPAPLAAPVDAGALQAPVVAPPPPPRRPARARQVVVDAEPRMPARVEMFTMTPCGPCTRAKKWLKENRVPFTERDIGVPANYTAALALDPVGGVGTPIITWDREVVLGFKKTRLEALLYPEGRKVTRMEEPKAPPVPARDWSASSAPRDLRAMYTYVDDDGAVQIVMSLDEVPERFRAAATAHQSH